MKDRKQKSVDSNNVKVVGGRSDHLSRRQLLAAGGAGLGLAAGGLTFAQVAEEHNDMTNYDPIHTELVMDLVVTCSSPEPMGPNEKSKDGIRDNFWPIIGGYFEGPDIRGKVVPGGADYPLVRPDGVVIIDAFYRLRTDDGINILIHNKGMAYPSEGSGWGKYRLSPVFTAPQGKYDWLNKSLFLSTLVETPEQMGVARGPNENDRLIQVHRVV